MKRQNIQQMVYEAAERFSDETAVSSAETVLSFGQLDSFSNCLANFLIYSGARPHAVIAILADDSARVVSSILACLKARCVFVALDSSIPVARLSSMLGQVEPSFFLAESRYFGLLNQLTQETSSPAKVILLDSDPSVSPADLNSSRFVYLGGFEQFTFDRRPDIDYAPDDFCYIYFTSGSTGIPKAIAGRLKGIDHFIRWEIDSLQLTQGTRVSRLLPFSFDGSLRDIFVPLCCGGSICIPPDRETVIDSKKFVDWIDGQSINLIHCVPSVFRLIANEQLRPEMFQHLRHIVMAGEAILPADVGKWKEVFGQRISLVNLYGTSETTMAKFVYFIKPGDELRKSIPVGKPIPGAKAIIIDEKGKVCGPGAIGEIYIRTPYRALGYYKDEQRTREVFVKNPFSDDDTDIVYRSGDLGRINEQGDIELIGRKDQQVKVRGIRVELGEIEEVMRRQAGVEDVAVAEREDRKGNKYLCVYVVGHAAIEAIGEGIRKELPEYMVPSRYVRMETLPRTISGKIDRRALPEPGEDARSGVRSYRAPRNELEAMVAGIWCEVLGLGRVGIDESFFDIGGHSLLATQVLSRVRESLKVEIPLRTLFEAPVLCDLAAQIEAVMRGEARGESLPLERASRDQDLPLSFAQQRLWFLDRLETNRSAYNLPAGVRITGQLNYQAITQCVDEICRRHEALRTTFALKQSLPVQIVTDRAVVTPGLIDLRALKPAEQSARMRRLAKEDAQRPFDLERGPLLRVTVLRMKEDEHVILFTMHHIISDGWSMGVLIREVASLYEAFSSAQPSPLEEIRIQYVDFAVWQRQWLSGEVLDRQLAFWKQQLGGKLPLLRLPTHQPRPAIQTMRGTHQVFAFSKELSETLRKVCRQENVTLFMVLLAAFKVLLYRYSGQTDIIVGTPVANRNRVDAEKLIGFFVNTVAMRSDLSGNPSLREMLRRTRKVALDAHAHQDAPFEKIVEAIQPDRRLNHTPIFQVWFVLQNTPTQEAKLSALDLTELDLENGSSRFDLALLFTDTTRGLVGVCDYNTDLLEANTVAAMAKHLEVILWEIANNPESRLLDLPLDTGIGEVIDEEMSGAYAVEDSSPEFVF